MSSRRFGDVPVVTSFGPARGKKQKSKKKPSEKTIARRTHVAGFSRPSGPLTNGVSSLWRFSPSYENRALSLIHSSFTPSCRRGTTRITSVPRVSTRMFDPKPSVTSTLSANLSSQARAVNAKGFEVSAPTGHKSMTFPLSSEVSSLLTYVPISAMFPRPVTPRSCTPATSVANRTQRVQWMHRDITVLTSGPSSLSSTARLYSVNRLRSLP